MIHPDLLPDGLSADRVAACVGLISDTHLPQRCLALPAAVFTVFRGVDVILHTGDVGELRVLDELSRLAPVVAVHGNDETRAAQRELPYQQVVAVAGQRILLWHSHFPDRVDEMLSRTMRSAQATLRPRRVAMLRANAAASLVTFSSMCSPWP